MPKLKVGLLCVLLLLLAVQVIAECWRWERKEIPCSPQWEAEESYMVYDDAMGKMALTIYREGGDLELWTFDGTIWMKEWGALPELPHGWGYMGPNSLYFDQNLNTLVVLSHFFVQPEVFCDGLHKYVPGQGWRLVEDCFNFWGTRDTVFDSSRSRAVIEGGFDLFDGSGKPYTLEFDGTNIYAIKNPEDFRFDTGKLGYNPETKKTVYFGYTEGKPDLGTYEYDGTTWIKIESSETPPLGVNGARPPWGFPYVPELGGLVFIPGNFKKLELWLYKEREWTSVPVETPSPSGRYGGVLAYDPIRKALMLMGGMIEVPGGGIYPNDFWTLIKRNHCRPLTRP